jgi:hypothetical protein
MSVHLYAKSDKVGCHSHSKGGYRYGPFLEPIRTVEIDRRMVAGDRTLDLGHVRQLAKTTTFVEGTKLMLYRDSLSSPRLPSLPS